MKNHDLARARSYFALDPGIVYLNHAAHPPMALPVRAAYEKFFDSWEKTAHDHDYDSFRMFEVLRAKLAAFIGASPERVALAPHTTFGMNVMASGLTWNRGDNLVLSEREFPASVYPWLRLRDKGVEVRFAETRGGFIDEDALIGLVDEKTRLIHTSWVQFNNGYRVDLDKLGCFCRDSGVLLSVDGMQGTGVIPIDVPSLGIDMFSAGCQKWMLGPCGTGFFYLSKRAEERIEPPYSGWLSVDWKAEFSNLMRYDLEPRVGPARYEIATYPFQDLWALNAAVDIIASFDRQAAWEHITSLLDTLISFIKGDSCYELVSSTEENRRSGILVFKAPETKALYDKLRVEGIVVSFREGGIRVSPHFYNSQDEIGRLIETVAGFGR